eukprot:CAMPEP_0181274718 /NCGR_PEP_ID=MMETSP1097-20121128/9423_1 /TAXON_ID=35684 /ORGANISM="Pseudopedinella elastica, Strain CCMP716" /LENGTH=42 /DNA_ID= /DNA_START= /DNA_END= /DNA_ORIENTATION=
MPLLATLPSIPPISLPSTGPLSKEPPLSNLDAPWKRRRAPGG